MNSHLPVCERQGCGLRPYRVALFWVCVLQFVLVELYADIASAQVDRSPNALESSLANAYVYLASRTVWPGNTSERFMFCINRGHPLFDSFASLLPSRKIAGKTVEMRSFDESDAADQRRCQLIALSKNSSANQTIAKNTDGFPVLTISHEVDITEDGGIVYLAHGVRLEPPKVNFEALEKSELKIDASVLDLSRRRWKR